MPRVGRQGVAEVAQLRGELLELARNETPTGTAVEAVCDQWLHALAYDYDCYGEKNAQLKRRLVSTIEGAGVRVAPTSLSHFIGHKPAIQSPRKSKFRFIDLFAGIGGMRIGFQAVGGRCVFSSEWDEAAQETYRRNHGELPFGDITKVPASAVPDHDVLLAGFPCQPFSHAGKKLGIEDTRGTLFHDIARILDAKRPRFALLENVRGLISHQQGETLRVILQTLTAIGYECNLSRELIHLECPKAIQESARGMLLRSNDFGVPQQRVRIYIVLWRKGELDLFRYPKPLGSTTRVGDVLEPSVDSRYRLSDRLWEGHQRRRRANELAGKGFGFGLVTPDSPYSNTISARYYKDGSEILVQDKIGVNPRKLTPREAARLQGFPEEFWIHPSSVQAYKQFGNSVSVPVIEAIARELARALTAHH
jgi:DNA (cytosine-5)-methyltransferase 1